MKALTSLQHPLVKHFVKLREDREYRYKSKRLIISGLKLIKELSSEHTFRTLIVENDFTLPFPIKAEQHLVVSGPILKKTTGLENPEPIAVEIDMPEPQDISSARSLLILDGVSDPGNLGTLLRTALGLGWDAAFITSGSTDPYNEKAMRSAKGATFRLPWNRGTVEELMTYLNNYTLLAADARGEDAANISIKGKVALALGNEAHGLCDALKNKAKMIAIPMIGPMESLNVATAGAILMHQLLRETR